VCQSWNSFIEEVGPSKLQRFEAASEKAAQPMRIKDVKGVTFKRVETGILEFDRLMGGGIVCGSLTLVGGDPGIGKSTLIMQLSQALAIQGLTVLYVCGEESVEQTSLRAGRLGVNSDHLYLLSETNFSWIKRHIDELKPDILIVDSIQIVYKQDLASAPGSVSQVREITTEFMHIAKGMGISTFLIGHVTKTGEIAGPRVLEHLVDTVLDFDGDRQHGYRMLRGIKNRFGPTDDLALFQMSGQGLVEVRNPSSIFLEERGAKTSGSAIVPTIEGSRAFLTEIQALVAPSAFSNAQRKSTGLNPNRLSLLLAVLEKRMNFQLHNKDVFVSVAGGLKIVEPAIDLAVVVAIASSFSNRALDSKIALMGEIGLGGEVRSIPRIESRLKEAINMGFTRCLLPARNLKGLARNLTQEIQLEGIDTINEALKILK
jgi:DNA repair protein RadA/Sms